MEPHAASAPDRRGRRRSRRRARWLVVAVAGAAATSLWGVGPVAGAGTRLSPAAVEPAVDPTRPLVISEFRVRGPNGANDEFIEITNVSNTDHLVAPVSGTGYGVAASDGTTRCSIPGGTLIPAFASYLCVNSVGYSLASYPAGNGTTATGDATYTTDIPDNAGIALFNNNVGGGSYALATRLDAVGSTSEANAVYKEGTGYPALTPFSIDYSFYRNLSTASITSTTLDTSTPGVPKDTDNNAADFVFVDTNGTSAGAGQRLGAPGPSNLSSPTTNGLLDVSLLDPCVGPLSPPNAVRDFTSSPPNNSTFGTIDLRRTITNNTGGPVTRLRLRVADVRTFPAPSGIADMRPRTSTAVVVTVDRPPCGSGTSTTTVQGTTLEQPPSQPNGGGFNSSMSVGVVTLATPLDPGASIDVRVLTGLQQTGSGGVRVIAEALTGGNNNVPDEGECLNAAPEGEDLCGLSSGTDIAIPSSGPATPYPSTIEADFPAGTTVRDANVTLHGFTHTFPGDVDVLLVGPDGTASSLVLSDIGSTNDVSGVNLTLDDEAANDVPSPIVSGTFRPTNSGTPDGFPAPAPAPDAVTSLANFDGIEADGTWSLYVVDDAGPDSGVISGWSLDLETAPGCENRPATIVGTDGADLIVGSAGNDVIVGLGGDDVIHGGDGNDRICGGTGADEIRDQGGADRLFGEVGDDLFTMTAVADDGDVVHGGDGTDHASYRGRTVDVSLTINGASDDGAAGEHDRLLAIEDLTGGDGNDFISGSGSANELFGRGGNDTLRDLTGSDQVFGGEGDDVFIAPGIVDPADTYNGATGVDSASYAARSVGVELSLNGLADDGSGAESDNLVGLENATGGSDDDTIIGNADPNRLSGGGADDVIDDLAGADTVTGGPGNDVFNQPAAVDNGDTFNGGAGVDKLSYALRPVPVAVSLAGGANDGAAGEGDAVTGVENAAGGAGGDTLVGNGVANRLEGNGGNDVLRDLGGADDLQGGAGDDDFVQGSAPDVGDEFNGGIGTDAVFYAQRTGAVTVTLGNGTDDDGAAGEIDGFSSVENAFGGQGNDSITGSAGDNFLRGGLGNDDLRGLAGDDDLFGDAGADDLHTLDGVNGNDVANGGTGADTATTDAGDTRLSIP